MTIDSLVIVEKQAWEAYRSYVLVRMPARGDFFRGDDTSHALFRAWQLTREKRDSISRPENCRLRPGRGRFYGGRP